MAELCPKMINTAISSTIVTTGSSHQRLFLAKNESSSPTIPNRLLAVSMKPMTFLLNYRVKLLLCLITAVLLVNLHRACPSFLRSIAATGRKSDYSLWHWDDRPAG